MNSPSHKNYKYINSKKKQAFLFLTDNPNSKIVPLVDQLNNSIKNLGNSYLLFHQKESINHENMELVDNYVFTDNIITESNYFPLGFSLVPGNNHYPLIHFFLKYPNYDYYWCIEDDVRFSGDWDFFFDSFSKIESDFISSHIHFSKNDRNWYWWKALAHPYQVIPFEERIRSFNPIYRISKQAIAFIHDALQSGWCGHHEVLLASLLYNAGFDIIDFGGTGEFVLPGYNNKYYIDNTLGLQDGTMRWRPAFTEVGQKKNKLYHPVK